MYMFLFWLSIIHRSCLLYSFTVHHSWCMIATRTIQLLVFTVNRMTMMAPYGYSGCSSHLQQNDGLITVPVVWHTTGLEIVNFGLKHCPFRISVFIKFWSGRFLVVGGVIQPYSPDHPVRYNWRYSSLSSNPNPIIYGAIQQWTSHVAKYQYNCIH